MAVPPLVALRAAGTTQGALQKALTGDVYVRRSIRIVGKGKNKHEVQDEFHLNPTQLAVGAGITAVGIGLAAWVLQLKIQPSKVVQRETIVDRPGVPAWDEEVRDYFLVPNAVAISLPLPPVIPIGEAPPPLTPSDIPFIGPWSYI
jgi:hypothetical protein